MRVGVNKMFLLIVYPDEDIYYVLDQRSLMFLMNGTVFNARFFM